LKEEEKKMRNLAVIPPMLLDGKQRRRRYHNVAGLLEDPPQVNLESMSRVLYWTAEEKDTFREKYLQRPKNFGYIAAALENKVK
jgi:nuclear receptor co-repressor 2